MQNFGFIHDKLDIKLLILFIMRRLPGIVSPIDLQDYVLQCDTGFTYFDYIECLGELCDSGLITEEESGLRCSKRGAEATEIVENSLPYSVRKRAEKLIGPESKRRRRLEMITAEHQVRRSGCFATLALNDGKGEIIRLNILTSGEEQAERIEENFRDGAEEIYVKIVELLEKRPDINRNIKEKQ